VFQKRLEQRKMDEQKALILILVGLLVGLVVYELPTIKAFKFPEKSINITTVNATIEVPRHVDYYIDIDKMILEDKLQQIYDIAYLNAQEHEYKLQVYDCTQFSESLVKKLRNLGYKAQCTAGFNYESDYPPHTWVSFWIDNTRYEIEATNGEFIPQEYFDEGVYEKKWENLCW